MRHKWREKTPQPRGPATHPTNIVSTNLGAHAPCGARSFICRMAHGSTSPWIFCHSCCTGRPRRCHACRHISCTIFSNSALRVSEERRSGAFLFASVRDCLLNADARGIDRYLTGQPPADIIWWPMAAPAAECYIRWRTTSLLLPISRSPRFRRLRSSSRTSDLETRQHCHSGDLNGFLSVLYLANGIRVSLARFGRGLVTGKGVRHHREYMTGIQLCTLALNVL